MAAEDDINEIIERALNLAQLKADDAGGYAHDALIATDTIHIDEGVGDVANVPALSTFATIPSIPGGLPQIQDGLELFQDIQGQLTGLASGVFQEFFPDIQSTYATTVNNLTALAAETSEAIGAIRTRLNRDASAVTYLDSAWANAGNARDYLNDRIDIGRNASAFLEAKYGTGSLAAAYLLRRFNAGDSAVTTLVGMMTGGMGIPAAVEDQLWERDRARTLKENARARDTLLDTFATRGYPVPPGALSMQLQMTNADAQDTIAQQSRDKAIKQVDVLIENIRTSAQVAFSGSGEAGTQLLSDASDAGKSLLEDTAAATRLTVEDAREAATLLLNDSARAADTLMENVRSTLQSMVNLRTQAIQAASDYIKTLFLPAEMGADVARTVTSAEAQASEAVVRLYSAEVQAVSAFNSTAAQLAEIQLRPAIQSSVNRVQLRTAYNQGLIGIANAKANAALGACVAAGNQGAAAISTLNAVASLTSSS